MFPDHTGRPSPMLQNLPSEKGGFFLFFFFSNVQFEPPQPTACEHCVFFVLSASSEKSSVPHLCNCSSPQLQAVVASSSPEYASPAPSASHYGSCVIGPEPFGEPSMQPCPLCPLLFAWERGTQNWTQDSRCSLVIAELKGVGTFLNLPVMSFLMQCCIGVESFQS